MKVETAVLFTKGLCYAAIGGLTPMATGLAQWADSGQWPPAINWVVIGAGCFVGAATQLLSFLSQSYGNWKIEVNKPANGDLTPPPANPPKP